MRLSFRIGIGFVLGCIPSFFALALAEVGHGTYTPLIANAPMLVLIPEIGILVAFFGTPAVWATYFLLIPETESRILGLFAVALVALVHVGAGAWNASQDTYLQRTFRSEPWPKVGYFAFLFLVVVMLGVLAGLGRRVREKVLERDRKTVRRMTERIFNEDLDNLADRIISPKYVDRCFGADDVC